MEQNLDLERAIERMLDIVRPVGSERRTAPEAGGRVLAQDVPAPMDQPPWPRSPLDGYALCAADTVGASPGHPCVLPVTGTVCAGEFPRAALHPGEALRVMTGAPLPSGCDCVVRQEDTDCGTESVSVYQALSPWQNYCFAGEDFRAGDVLLSAGTRLDGNAMGLLASAGLYRADVTLAVYRCPRCALICTGDELTGQETRPLPPGKIYSSNAVGLSHRLRGLGVELVFLRETFSDDADALARTLETACGSVDAVFTTGGVSVGQRDILHDALALQGAERVFWRVAMKPGTPLLFSVFHDTPILSLSGNPFAASATFELFGRPLLARLAHDPGLLPHRVRGILDGGFPKTGGRRFVRGLYRDGHVWLPETHSPGQLRSAAGTNCLAEIPAGTAPLPPMSEVTVYLL